MNTKPINWFVVSKETKRVITSFASRERAREFAKENNGTVKHIDDLSSEQVATIGEPAPVAAEPAPAATPVVEEQPAPVDARPEPKTLRERLVRKVEDLNAKTAMKTIVAPKPAKKRANSAPEVLTALAARVGALVEAKSTPCEMIRTLTTEFPKVRRAEMLEACTSHGLNRHTVSRQFGLTKNGSVKPKAAA